MNCKGTVDNLLLLVSSIRISYLGEIANYVVASHITLRHDIKQEGVSVVVESLVVEEKLGK